MKTLHLSPTLSLPLDATVNRMAFIGTTNSGKTYGAMKCAEQMWKNGLQFIAVDPLGIWWAMRLAADGTKPGIPITIFGGPHGDLPLREQDGALVADVIVSQRISAILDISHFETEAEKVRFVHRLGERLYHLKKTNPSGLHVFLEEADEFIPQNTVGGDAQMVHVWNVIWKRGGNFGLGGSIITQRPQDVNKKALELSAAVFAFNVTGSNAFDAMQKWMKGVPELATLPELQQGECLLWSPSWLKRKERLKIGEKETFHARFDPNAIDTCDQRDRTLAPIAVEALRDRFTEVIHEEEENDPKKLRARISELEKSGGKPGQPLIDEAVQAATAPLVRKIDTLENLIQEAAPEFEAALAGLQNLRARFTFGDTAIVTGYQHEDHERNVFRTESEVPQFVKEHHQRATQVADDGPKAGPTDLNISGPQMRILNALSEFKALGLEQVQRSHIALRAGISPKSSGFDKNLSTLRTAGLIEYVAGQRLTLTRKGFESADFPTRDRKRLTLNGLHETWINFVSGPQGRILRELIAVYPKALPRDNIAAQTGQSVTSSGFDKNLSTLKSLGVVAYHTGRTVAATELLFPEGLH